MQSDLMSSGIPMEGNVQLETGSLQQEVTGNSSDPEVIKIEPEEELQLSNVHVIEPEAEELEYLGSLPETEQEVGPSHDAICQPLDLSSSRSTQRSLEGQLVTETQVFTVQTPPSHRSIIKPIQPRTINIVPEQLRGELDPSEWKIKPGSNKGRPSKRVFFEKTISVANQGPSSINANGPSTVITVNLPKMPPPGVFTPSVDWDSTPNLGAETFFAPKGQNVIYMSPAGKNSSEVTGSTPSGKKTSDQAVAPVRYDSLRALVNNYQK